MKKQQEISEQIRRHYAIEKQIAQRLRTATKQDRRGLYATAYDELFKSLPDHPQLLRKGDDKATALRIAGALRVLQPFLNPKITFLEVGAGDCAVSKAVARMVKKVYAVDVSLEITGTALMPSNFQLVLSDGTSIPVPENSVDVVYSNQLMEHLHPDDALEQLQNIYRVLRQGGIYICSTPHRLRGPHDISKYFDDIAQGLHLKEYTISELYHLFKTAGFIKQRYYLLIKKIRLILPIAPFRIFEQIVEILPTSFTKPFMSSSLMSVILGIRMVATK